MRLKGEEYSKRLEGYSDATLQLISDIKRLSKAEILEAAEITTDSELTEEEVVAKLKELQARSSR